MAGTDRIAGEADAWRERGPAGRARVASAPLWADACWVGILLAAGSFQIGRGAPVEGVPFVLAAVALAADRAGWLWRLDRPFRAPRAPRWVAVLVTALTAVIVGTTPVFGWGAGVLVAAAGFAAIAPTWARRGGRTPGEVNGVTEAAAAQGIRRAAVAWGSVAVALCLWELASFFAGVPSARADWEHPALSDLVKPAVELPVVRAVLFAAWLAAGWALVRRGREATAAAPVGGGGRNALGGDEGADSGGASGDAEGTRPGEGAEP